MKLHGTGTGTAREQNGLPYLAKYHGTSIFKLLSTSPIWDNNPNEDLKTVCPHMNEYTVLQAKANNVILVIYWLLNYTE